MTTTIKAFSDTTRTGGTELVTRTNLAGNKVGLDINIEGSNLTLLNTEYTEAATDSTITGIVTMAENPSDRIYPIQADSKRSVYVHLRDHGLKSGQPIPTSPQGRNADWSHSSSSVTTSSSTIASSSATRGYLLVQNISDTSVFINLIGASAVVNQGIELKPKGGFYEAHIGLGGVPRLAVNAIHGGTGSKTVLVTTGSYTD